MRRKPWGIPGRKSIKGTLKTYQRGERKSKSHRLAESKRRKTFKEGLLTASNATKRSNKVKVDNHPLCLALRESLVKLARAAS